MWTQDTCIDVTPTGRYVTDLRREDRRLEELQHPGKDSADQRVRRIAVRAEAMADNLRGSIREELAHCGALPLGPEPEDLPGTCAVCGLCSIHAGGPSCFDEQCPNSLAATMPCRRHGCHGHTIEQHWIMEQDGLDRDGWPLDYEPSEARTVISAAEMARRIAEDF